MSKNRSIRLTNALKQYKKNIEKRVIQEYENKNPEITFKAISSQVKDKVKKVKPIEVKAIEEPQIMPTESEIPYSLAISMGIDPDNPKDEEE